MLQYQGTVTHKNAKIQNDLQGLVQIQKSRKCHRFFSMRSYRKRFAFLKKPPRAARFLRNNPCGLIWMPAIISVSEPLGENPMVKIAVIQRLLNNLASYVMDRS